MTSTITPTDPLAARIVRTVRRGPPHGMPRWPPGPCVGTRPPGPAGVGRARRAGMDASIMPGPRLIGRRPLRPCLSSSRGSVCSWRVFSGKKNPGPRTDCFRHHARPGAAHGADGALGSGVNGDGGSSCKLQKVSALPLPAGGCRVGACGGRDGGLGPAARPRSPLPAGPRGESGRRALWGRDAGPRGQRAPRCRCVLHWD